MAGKITAAKYIAHSLESWGVTEIFFVPTILSVALAEMDKGTSIRRILTHSEKSAAYMADGYARAKRAPGVCMSQVIGTSNLAAGLREPFMSKTPVVALTGAPTATTANRNTYQQIDEAKVFDTVTKWRGTIQDVEELPTALPLAFRQSVSDTPGPTHLSLPNHVGEIERDLLEHDGEFPSSPISVPEFRAFGDPERIKHALNMIASANRPIIVAGGGARVSGASDELITLAEALNIPVATSINGKDLIPATHYLHVGTVGMYSRKPANLALFEADLVIYVGSATGNQVTCNWLLPKKQTPIIQIDNCAGEIGRHYPNTFGILGDAKSVLHQFFEAQRATDLPSHKDWLARVQTIIGSWREEVAELLTSEQIPIRPERLCTELSRILPSDALVAVDTGHSGMWGAGLIDLNHPKQSFIRAAGSLGWGVPATIGAQFACPERPTVLFTGDGGFWYHAVEIETAVRWGLNCVFVVNNNCSLNQEIDIYKSAYGGELTHRHGDLWKFRDVDFVAMAESMGASGLRVDHPNDIEGALDKAFKQKGPTVLDVRTELHALAPLAEIGGGELLGFTPPPSI